VVGNHSSGSIGSSGRHHHLLLTLVLMNYGTHEMATVQQAHHALAAVLEHELHHGQASAHACPPDSNSRLTCLPDWHAGSQANQSLASYKHMHHHYAPTPSLGGCLD
jgi:hypothetical protein